MSVSKKRSVVFLVIFIFFAGSNIGGITGLNTILKLTNNVLSLYILSTIIFPVIKTKKLPKLTPITGLFLLFLGVYITITVCVGGELVFNNITTMLKSAILLLWIDQQVRTDMTLLDGPILAAFYIWCSIDTLITLIYPTGVPFLSGGYILGWKNNKIMYFVIANLLAAYHFINLKDIRKKIEFLALWGILAIGCIINSIIIESSTTAMVVFLIILFVPLKKFLTHTCLVNEKFVLIFHSLSFFLIIFVRDMFQEPLDQMMNFFFGKDATFTGRIYIWRMALAQIVKSPLWGYGKYATQYVKLPSGYEYAWTMAHNQVLDLMMRGGIILVILWISVLLFIMKVNKKTKSFFSKMSTYTLFCLLFFFHTEASIDVITYLIFLCLYLIGQKEITNW